MSAQAPEPPVIRLCALHDICFKQAGVKEPKSYYMTSISLTHVGFARAPSSVWPSAGTVIDGTVLFENEKVSLPAKIKLKRGTKKCIECEWVNPSQELKDWISRYFESELSAMGMRRINPKYHKQEPDGLTLLYYNDDGNCSLYFVVDEMDRVKRFKLAFLGNCFEGGVGLTLTAGVVVDDVESDKPAYKGSDLVRDQQVSLDLMDFISRFLINIPNLKTHHRLAIGEFVSRGLTSV
jgi:hypothetical protein